MTTVDPPLGPPTAADTKPEPSGPPAVEVQSLEKTFRIPHRRYSTFKERALHPFRWLHAYGVFPPQTPPSVRIVPVIEVSWDGAPHSRT